MIKGLERNRYVYHYTGFDSLFCLLEGYRKGLYKGHLPFWGFNVFNANDPMEMKVGFNAVKAFICNSGIESEVPEIQKLSEVYENIRNEELCKKEYLGANHDQYSSFIPYTVSFSAKRDFMPMWSLYGKMGKGVSLVFDAIERIEVLKGGASALYGSDAVGGVINVITKQPEKTEIRLNAGVGSWRTENYRASVAAIVGKTGILVTAQKERQAYLKYKDANDSSTKRWDKSDYSTDNVDVKLTQDIGKDQQATLYFHHSYKNGNQPIYIGSTLGPSAGSDLNNDVSLQYDWGKDTDHAGYVRLYRNYYVGNYYSDSGDNHYTETKRGIDVQQNFRLSENNKLTAGLEWRDSHIGSGLYDGQKKIVTKAIFLQDTWNFAPEWTLTLGDRYDKHNMFGHKNTLSAGLNKKFGEKGHAYLTWGQVFRAPQGNDLYWLEDWGWGLKTGDGVWVCSVIPT